MTARVRYLRSTTEAERKPAQGADDVLKLHQPTLCLDSRQLTASLSLIGCTSLLAESIAAFFCSMYMLSITCVSLRQSPRVH